MKFRVCTNVLFGYNLKHSAFAGANALRVRADLSAPVK